MKPIQLIFLLIALSVTTGLSCATVAPSEPQVGASTPASPDQVELRVPEPVGLAQPERVLYVVPTPTPGAYQHLGLTALEGDPLDHKVFFSDVIALVSLKEVKAESETVPSEDAGTAPTYRAVTVFHFDVIEYLHGSGGGEIIVQDPANHTFLTDAEAQENSDLGLMARTSKWDDRVAVVFLYEATERSRVPVSTDPSTPNYGFLTMASNIWGEHTIGHNGRAWLPSNEHTYDEAAGQHSETALQKAGEALEFFTSSEPEEESGFLPFITLGDLRSLIADVEATRQEGAGIEGYEECLNAQFHRERQIRGWEALYGRPYSHVTAQEEFPSGQAAGTAVHEAWMLGGEFGTYWLTGADADLFTAGIVDDDGEVIIPDDRHPAEYYLSIKTARPLPSGDYKFTQHEQFPSWVPCELTAEGPYFEISIVPPEGTIYEGFFDPADSDGAIGATRSVGVLKPGAFSVGGTDTAFASLTWKEEVVTLELEQFVTLAGHALDFIILDGSVSLTLSFDEATAAGDSGTFTWPMADSPWQEGDQLLLRARVSE